MYLDSVTYCRIKGYTNCSRFLITPVFINVWCTQSFYRDRSMGGAKGAIAHPVSYGYGLDNQIKPSFEDKLNKISKSN